MSQLLNTSLLHPISWQMKQTRNVLVLIRKLSAEIFMTRWKGSSRSLKRSAQSFQREDKITTVTDQLACYCAHNNLQINSRCIVLVKLKHNKQKDKCKIKQNENTNRIKPLLIINGQIKKKKEKESWHSTGFPYLYMRLKIMRQTREQV